MQEILLFGMFPNNSQLLTVGKKLFRLIILSLSITHCSFVIFTCLVGNKSKKKPEIQSSVASFHKAEWMSPGYVTVGVRWRALASDTTILVDDEGVGRR